MEPCEPSWVRCLSLIAVRRPSRTHLSERSRRSCARDKDDCAHTSSRHTTCGREGTPTGKAIASNLGSMPFTLLLRGRLARCWSAAASGQWHRAGTGGIAVRPRQYGRAAAGHRRQATEPGWAVAQQAGCCRTYDGRRDGGGRRLLTMGEITKLSRARPSGEAIMQQGTQSLAQPSEVVWTNNW